MASITKRGNSYRIKVYAGYDINGKQIVHTKTWTPDRTYTERQLKKELDRVAALFEDQVKTGQVIDASVRFADFSTMWIEQYAKKQLRLRTLSGYMDMLNVVNQKIGHVRLEQLQPHRLMALYDDLEKNGRREKKTYIPKESLLTTLQALGWSISRCEDAFGVSKYVVNSLRARRSISVDSAAKIAQTMEKPIEELFDPTGNDDAPLAAKTVMNYHRLISSILETAVKWQVIPANPCDRVQPPKVPRKEARYLNEEQAATILDCLRGEPLKWRAAITLLLYSGMRRGELCGLTWQDVNMEHCIIDINKSSLYLPGEGVFDDETKNESSVRTIKISRFVMDLLREWREEQYRMMMDPQALWTGPRGVDIKVFTNTTGSPLNPDVVTDWFHNFIRRHHLPSACVHSLRHTNATLMIASGVNLRTVSSRLGHAQTSTTTNIYAHAIRTADEMASDAIGGYPGSQIPQKSIGTEIKNSRPGDCEMVLLVLIWSFVFQEMPKSERNQIKSYKALNLKFFVFTGQNRFFGKIQKNILGMTVNS